MYPVITADRVNGRPMRRKSETFTSSPFLRRIPIAVIFADAFKLTRTHTKNSLNLQKKNYIIHFILFLTGKKRQQIEE